MSRPSARETVDMAEPIGAKEIEIDHKLNRVYSPVCWREMEWFLTGESERERVLHLGKVQ